VGFTVVVNMVGLTQFQFRLLYFALAFFNFVMLVKYSRIELSS